jgi:hydroxymethylpyrimidine pyrophosphatase-like HAD family hydrolase
LADLVRAGILVGIATGRGKSVRKDLRKILPDRSHWDRVLVGYHNGGEIGWLSDDAQPPETIKLDRSLHPIEAAMRAEPRLTRAVKMEAKLRQITLELPRESECLEVWNLAETLVRRQATAGVTLVRSSHSIDVLAPGVSKRLLVDRLRQELSQAGRAGSILCIGDKGRWPGNDFAFLEETLSLSVDEASSDPSTCWNLAAPGERCVSATLTYLRSLRIDAGQFTIEF